MKKEDRGYTYEITAQGEAYQFHVWPRGTDTRARGLSWGSPRTAEEAERMVKDWIDTQEGRKEKGSKGGGR